MTNPWEWEVDRQLAAVRDLIPSTEVRVAAFLLLVGCSYTPRANALGDGGDADATDAIDANAGSARKKTITIANGNVAGDLVDFPVWIAIPADAQLAASARTDGTDIYFTSATGTALEHELRTWNPATGELQAWVRADLQDLTDTVIELRYGDLAAAHAANPAAVFDNGFLAVWHLDDDLATTTSVIETLGQHTGIAVGGPTAATGKLGGGFAIDGNDDEITFTNPYSGNTSHTMSAWVDITRVTNLGTLILVGNPNNGQARFIDTNYNAGIGYGFFGAGNDRPDQSAAVAAGFKLVHWVYEKNGASQVGRLYIDGVQQGGDQSLNGVSINTGTGGGHLGLSPGNFGPSGNPNTVEGVLDEVRLAGVARDGAWIQTEFTNQNDPGAFSMIGMEQPAD